jgi:DNA-binding transcriptional regulator YiaG
MTARMALRLASAGHPWPEFAAAVLAERGKAGLDREAFAAALGVSVATLAGVEDGVLGDTAPSRGHS